MTTLKLVVAIAAVTACLAWVCAADEATQCMGGANSGCSHEVQQLLEENQRLQAEVMALQLNLWQTRSQLRDTRVAWEATAELRPGQPTSASVAQDLPVPSSVDRRDAASLSFDEFMREYANKSRPVVITGLQDIMFGGGATWDIDYFRRVCGQRKVMLLKYQADAAAWGRLVHAREQVLSKFIDDFKEGVLPKDKQLYLHDWSLPAYCPEIFTQPDTTFTVPKYFAGDLLQYLHRNEKLFYRDEWPSLFIGPKGSMSGLHVDSFGSNFFMYLIQGEKKWRFFPEGNRAMLYEDVSKSTFEVNAFNPDYSVHPLARLTTPYECTIGPGDVLFVPAGSPHEVINLSDTVAISANYIDQSNFARALNEIEREGKAGFPGSKNMADALREITKDPRRLHQRWNKNQEALPWKRFKNQR